MNQEWIRVFGGKIIRCLHLTDLLRKDAKTTEAISLLKAREEPRRAWERVWQERIGTLAVVMIAILLLAIIVQVTREGDPLSDGYVERQEQLPVDVTMTQDDTEVTRRIVLEMGERELTKKEKQTLIQELTQKLPLYLCGKNRSLAVVNQKLNLPERIPEYPVTIHWSVDGNYIKEDGRLRSQSISSSGIDTSVIASVSWNDWKHDFNFLVHLISPKQTPTQEMVSLVRKELRRSIRQQNTKQTLKLPSEVEGVQLTYHSTEEESGSEIWIMLLIPLLLPLCWQEQMKKKRVVRSSQLQMDYPEMIHKIILLLGAGLTIRTSIRRMVDDYEKKRQSGAPIRYLYEELTLVCNEINNGISESRAIEHFGVRCGHLSYLRFTTLVTQNMRKGAAGLLKLLEQEAMDSLEQRRELVKQMGEQASTKLLLPMGMMLVLVIGIVMIPALMTI